MSTVIEETTTRTCGCAGRGRHKDACPLKTEQLLSEAAEVAVDDTPCPAGKFYGLPNMPDEEMEQYGGDLSALESVGTRSNSLSHRKGRPTTQAMPDLSYKGMLVSRHAPHKRFHFTYVDKTIGDHAKLIFQQLRQRGYKPVTTADFYVHSTLRDVLISDDGTATGWLTLGEASKAGTTGIYAQDEDNYTRMRRHERRFTDHIDQAFYRDAAQMRHDLAREGFGGVSTSAQFEDDV